MDRYQLLLAALNTKSPIEIIYHGGSQPGTKRRVIPIKVTMEEIRAIDIATNKRKVFLLKKIEMPAEGSAGKEYKAHINEHAYFDLRDVLKNLKDTISQAEWYISSSDDCIALHKIKKTGEPYKRSIVRISERHDAFIDEIATNASRRWRVEAPDYVNARIFVHLNKAVIAFLDQAMKHAPLQDTTHSL